MHQFGKEGPTRRLVESHEECPERRHQVRGVREVGERGATLRRERAYEECARRHRSTSPRS